jgi:mono/diheme cytochrome c family protein
MNRLAGRGLAVVQTAAAIAVFCTLGVAATGGRQATEMRSTQGGVYTAEQAARGETTFAGNCTGCHTMGAYATPAFVKRWNGRPLGELYSLIAETMPEDFPGALTPGEYVQVVAYMLKLNRMPAGAEELPADPAALNKIRFEVPERVMTRTRR